MKILRIVDSLVREVKKQRNRTYQDQWMWMSFDSLLYAAAYKIERARLTKDLDKKLDDLLDAINYLRFAAARVLMEKKRDLSFVR